MTCATVGRVRVHAELGGTPEHPVIWLREVDSDRPLTPNEARDLAAQLIKCADRIDPQHHYHPPSP